mgnify:CR=1 FL=1
MVEFLRIQFLLGRVTAAQISAFAPRFLSAAQAQEITGGGGADGL